MAVDFQWNPVIPGSLGKLQSLASLGYGPGGPVPVPVPESENLCCADRGVCRAAFCCYGGVYSKSNGCAQKAMLFPHGYLQMPPVHSATLANSQPCLIIFRRLHADTSGKMNMKPKHNDLQKESIGISSSNRV